MLIGCDCLSAETVIASRRSKLLKKISVSENKLCIVFVGDAANELLGCSLHSGLDCISSLNQLIESDA